MTGSDSSPTRFAGSTLAAALLKGGAPLEELRFSAPFTIGRVDGCELQISDPAVSRRHLLVEPVPDGWRLKDLGSGNGTFVDGERITEIVISSSCSVELGKGGPLVSLRIELFEDPEQETIRICTPPLQVPEAVQDNVPKRETATEAEEEPDAAAVEKAPDPTTESQILRRYFSDTPPDDAGEQTLMFRRAFTSAHKKKSKKYLWVIGIVLMLLGLSGGVILYQQSKLEKMRETAQNIFYLMKELQVQIAKLDEMVTLNATPEQRAELQAKKDKIKGMEKEYDKFVKELGIYAKLSDEDRIIMRIARVFGECELTMPKGFASEVKKYIAIWKSTDRLQTSLRTAADKGYMPLITGLLKESNLPPQYLFLALQESNFDERAIGPPTRYGHAKGMWQFISLTADQYGLRVGPRFDKPVYDPLDERFDSMKASRAAVKYLKDLTGSSTQASGLLAMASYNWGDGNVRQMIGRMPENPRDRNFWQLLARKDIPKETYDYVFLIFAAAVICEDPKLFGFDLAGVTLPRTSSLPTGRISHFSEQSS